uniref:Secreted protein n=1 Tax=Arundo donax TaxID=35708 RepID=A0A0A9CSK1_ARUDO
MGVDLILLLRWGWCWASNARTEGVDACGAHGGQRLHNGADGGSTHRGGPRRVPCLWMQARSICMIFFCFSVLLL